MPLFFTHLLHNYTTIIEETVSGGIRSCNYSEYIPPTVYVSGGPCGRRAAGVGGAGGGVELETEPPKAARGSCAPGTSPALHAPETAVVYKRSPRNSNYSCSLLILLQLKRF